MPTDLWSFTLDFYARPGVEQACLTLQAHGNNVCQVLCGVWLGARGVECNAQRLAQTAQLATPWHDEVVQPLRALRTQWRTAAREDAALEALRTQVKQLELEAEQQLLGRLEALTGDWPTTETHSVMAWLDGIVADGAEESRDALQVLRIAADATGA